MYLINRNRDFNELASWLNEGFAKRSIKVDVVENEKEFTVLADVPGVLKKDIELKVEDGYITINITKDENIEEKEEKKFIRRERRIESVSRTIYVGDITDENIKAKLDNGVLNIVITKQPKVETKKIISIE